MNIQEITTDALRKMADTEGLVIQGCGGDLREWVDGINRMLTDYGVFSGGGKFETALAFRHEGRTCLLFPFDGVRLDGGKLAAWRLMTMTFTSCPSVRYWRMPSQYLAIQVDCFGSACKEAISLEAFSSASGSIRWPRPRRRWELTP